MHSGEWGIKECSQALVVKPDDRNLTRDGFFEFLQCLKNADGSIIISGKDTIKRDFVL